MRLLLTIVPALFLVLAANAQDVPESHNPDCGGLVFQGRLQWMYWFCGCAHFSPRTTILGRRRGWDPRPAIPKLTPYPRGFICVKYVTTIALNHNPPGLGRGGDLDRPPSLGTRS